MMYRDARAEKYRARPALDRTAARAAVPGEEPR
jgi:hypothetical protein